MLGFTGCIAVANPWYMNPFEFFTQILWRPPTSCSFGNVLPVESLTPSQTNHPATFPSSSALGSIFQWIFWPVHIPSNLQPVQTNKQSHGIQRIPTKISKKYPELPDVVVFRLFFSMPGPPSLSIAPHWFEALVEKGSVSSSFGSCSRLFTGLPPAKRTEMIWQEHNKTFKQKSIQCQIRVKVFPYV